MISPRIAALALLFVAAGCHHRDQGAATPPPALPPAEVRLEVAGSQRQVATEQVVGTVRAKLRATLEAKVSGRIEQFLATPGQTVQASDLLVHLDVREVRARLDQALAIRQQATRDLERFTALLRQEAVTQSEYDAVEARSRVAAAAVVEAETQLDHARVVAPFNGVITRKLADVGDLASPGRPLLEIEDPAAFRLEADVPETTVGRLRPGDRLEVRVAALPESLEGVVAEIAPAADPGSRTFRVKLDLPARPELRSGQFGRVAVPLAETQSLQVPVTAVVQRGQLELAFVATNGVAQMRLIKTGKHAGSHVEVLSGVLPGETVVVEGAENLRDGQPLRSR